MAADPNAVEQAVSRTLRDNLERIQRTADELHQAINDLVSACASSRPSNALPSMVRAQTSAACAFRHARSSFPICDQRVAACHASAIRTGNFARAFADRAAQLHHFEQPPLMAPHPIEESGVECACAGDAGLARGRGPTAGG